MKLGLLVLFSAAFPLTHLLLSHGRIREQLVAKLGLWPFRGLYSLVSIFTLGAAVELYRHDPLIGPVLWELPPWLALTIAAPLMFFALQLLFLSLANPSPSSMFPAASDARGVLRITRHPVNMAFAGFGLAHLAANGNLGSVAFFGAFAVLGLAGPYHLDRRKLRERGDAFAGFAASSSVLPFVAIVRRRNRLELAELSFPLVLMAAAAFAALLLLHGRLFGVALL